MNNYRKKVKHIVPTFLWITFGCVAGLAFLRYFLTILFEVVEINEDIWNFWIPMLLPWIPITLWLRQRFRVLTFKKTSDRERTLFLFQVIAAATITAMLLISQKYLTTSTGKLTELEKLEDISKFEKSRYYKLTPIIVFNPLGSSYTDFRVGGKYGQDFNMSIYFVTPIVNTTSLDNLKCWIGIKFRKRISNRLSEQEKRKEYNIFFEQCVKEMNNYDYSSVDHLERLPKSPDLKYYILAIEHKNPPLNNDDFIVLKPIKEKYSERNGNKLFWIFGSFGIGFSVLLLSLMFCGYNEKERQKFLKGIKPKNDDIKDMLTFLIPKDPHFVTSILISLKIAVLLVMLFSGVNIIAPNGEEMLGWGGVRRFETVINGDYWRLFTSMFIHGGIIHLIMNIFGLVLGGLFVESALGRKQFAFLYILSGIFGSFASIIWYSNTVSVGASGAIFGLYGAGFVLLLIDNPLKENRKPLLSFIGIYIAINLIFGFLINGIDNAAHIGGLLSGGAIAFILHQVNSIMK